MKNYSLQFKIFGISIIFLTFHLLLFTTAKAYAEGIALGVYPPVIQITAIGPSEIRSPITVSNESATPVTVDILVRPFTQDNSNDGHPKYVSSGQHIGEDPDIFKKMSIFDGQKNTDTITLAPAQKKNIELRISLPSGEAPSDYYFSITFLSKPVATDHTSGSAIAGGVTTNVLLSIGPTGPTTGSIKDFSSPLFVDHGPVPFTLLVTNSSKHFISPQGTILLKNMFGQTIGKVNIRQENILAGTSRYLPDDTAGSTSYQAAHPVSVWGEKFLLGPYSATLTLALSGEGPLYRRTIYFFALPLQVLLGITAGILLVTFIAFRVREQMHS